MDLGMNMLLDTVLKKLNIDPVEIKKTIAGVVQITVNAEKRLSAIEAQNARIERRVMLVNDKLNLLIAAKGLDYAGTEIDPAGTADGLEPGAPAIGGPPAHG